MSPVVQFTEAGMDPRPITLSGRHVRLEPLTLAHGPDLFAAVSVDRTVFRWWLGPTPAGLPELEATIQASLAAQGQGAVIPFAQIDPASGRAVGVTTYLNINRRDRGLEIGGTWLGRPWQRTGVNTEAKYLLLRHAFEDLGAARVQLRTDARNLPSQRAIERLGAVREGVLRKYQRVWDGFLRDSVMYSILDDEWPAVKARLEALLKAPHGSERAPP
jgi:RimJ/RimL family protein N-acetyltransferase